MSSSGLESPRMVLGGVEARGELVREVWRARSRHKM